jgi:hypothetical protein
MIVALVVVLTVIITRRDIAYSLVAVWALAGIAVEQSLYPNIITVAEIAIAIILVALILSLAVGRLRHKRTLILTSNMKS